jgi:hypothetical protein
MSNRECTVEYRAQWQDYSGNWVSTVESFSTFTAAIVSARTMLTDFGYDGDGIPVHIVRIHTCRRVTVLDTTPAAPRPGVVSPREGRRGKA